MNRLLLIIVALLGVSAFTGLIQACKCREYGTPICARFWRSDAVFVGQVVDIRPFRKKRDDVYTYAIVRFMVKILSFDLARDGKWLAFARRTVIRDVNLITDTSKQ